MDKIKSFFSSSPSSEAQVDRKRTQDPYGRRAVPQNVNYYGQPSSYEQFPRNQGYRGGYYPYSLSGGAGKKRRSGRKKSRKTKRKTRGRKSRRRA